MNLPTPSKKVLYHVKGREGAHMLTGVRECMVALNSAIYADMQLIGAQLPFSVRIEEIKEFDPAKHAPTPPKYPTIASLAQEAVLVYSLDPGRVQRAALLSYSPYNVQQAKYDYLRNPITPSLDNLIVKGSTGWYLVSKGSCTCYDHARENVCKHRIAAWIHRELVTRTSNAVKVPAILPTTLRAKKESLQ